MNFLMSLSWLDKSIIAMICLIPLMLLFNFFGKNYGVKPEVMMFGWFFGTAIGFCLLAGGGIGAFNFKDLYTPFFPILCVIGIGIVLGTCTNLFLAQAIHAAPNPALPFTILNISNVVVYVSAPVLAMVLPKYFDSMSFSWINFSGILLITVGIGLVVHKNM